MRRPEGTRQRPAELYVDCVVLTSFVAEFTFLRNVLGLMGIRMHHAGSLEEADFLLTVTGSRVLLADIVFADGTCYDALGMIGDRHPLVAGLVAADPPDRTFLQAVFSSGALGILWKPLEFGLVRKSIRIAHEASTDREVLMEELGVCGVKGAL